MSHHNSEARAFSPLVLTVSLATATAIPSLATAQATSLSVVEGPPTRIVGFETANMNHAGTVELNIGARQNSPSTPTGTGNQVYNGGGSYAFTDRFTMGIDVQNYVDPIGGPVAGFPTIPQIETTQVALWGKYQLYNNGRVSIAALGSVENFVSLKSDFWGGFDTNQDGVFIGAIKAPITYTASPKLQFHLTPGVTLAPDDVAGDEFYGTIVSLGAGVSYRASNRVLMFGTVETALSGENTINSDGNFEAVPVWTVGGRYNVTPRLGLEGYLTNGWGNSPATSVMTFWPDGDDVLAGARLIYTPGANRPLSYRDLSLPPTTRQVHLQQDGFTLGAADTLEPGMLRTDIWGGSDNNKGIALSFSPDRDGEIQVIFEQYSDNPTADPDLVPTTSVRYMIGPKLRFMDQNNGNLFSLTGRMLYGRQINSDPTKVGVFYTDLIATYKTQSGLSLTVSPKIGAFGNNELVGFGMGVNYGFGNGLELIAEVTPVGRDGDETTWAAGARYHLGQSGFSIDAQATNAIGRQGIGSMVAQDDTRFALTLSKTFDLNGLKFY
ncbi:DUF1302 family protein [Shimia sp. MMG029]|uniref:DUF1302 family protein n=1 Tax=Shimia sp. MMG029 TaxID=3021978 RepID=UPI0022FE84B8|nr:DUF1302 family protein [Shimia sp. MMG029]MDA5558378.1 hypothetical protein [Shimia sp. MMG029]